ncbi:hypothetical protein KR009_003135 [Drosophila setifemur]|nr:hypothetical protein KR009_003135 [Drosophila setifemur]
MLKKFTQIAGIHRMRTALNLIPFGANPLSNVLGSWWRRYSANPRLKPQFPFPSPENMRRHQIIRPRGVGTPSTDGPLSASAERIEKSQSRAVGCPEDRDEGESPEAVRVVKEEKKPDSQLEYEAAAAAGSQLPKAGPRLSNSRGQDLWNKAMTAAREKSLQKAKDEESELPQHEPGPFTLMPPLKPAKALNFLYQQSILNGSPISYASIDADVHVDSIGALEQIRRQQESRRAQKKMLELMEKLSQLDQLEQDAQDREDCNAVRLQKMEGQPPRRSRSLDEKLRQQSLIAQEPSPRIITEAEEIALKALDEESDPIVFRQAPPISAVAEVLGSTDYAREQQQQQQVMQMPHQDGRNKYMRKNQIIEQQRFPPYKHPKYKSIPSAESPRKQLKEVRKSRSPEKEQKKEKEPPKESATRQLFSAIGKKHR